MTCKVYRFQERYSVFDFAEVQNKFQSSLHCSKLLCEYCGFHGTTGILSLLQYILGLRTYIRRSPCL